MRQHVSPTSDMLCPSCKKERSCHQCKKNLREVDFDKRTSGHLYDVCRACQHPTCSICGTTRESIWTPHPKAKKPVAFCDACESKHTCADCERRLDPDEFDKEVLANHLKDPKRALKCLACAPLGLRADTRQYECTSCRSTFGRKNFVDSQVRNWNRGKTRILKCNQCRDCVDG